MRYTLLLLAACLYAGSLPADRIASALGKTDDRIAAFEALAKANPEDFHYQTQLAAAFVQKMRENSAGEYLERASKLIENVLAAEGSNYDALRLRSEIELERHQFAEVARHSAEMTRTAPDDPWNWGTLGDALMELGRYDEAANAYQRMIALRPDLASYNRASYYRFVAGDAQGAIQMMGEAIRAGSRSPENVAWCLTDLGNLYFKTGRIEDAAKAYAASQKLFPNYHPALAGLGRAEAAAHRYAEAIEHYRRAQAIVPLPDYAAALEHLYAKTGQREEARKQQALIDTLDHMEQVQNQTTNRNLALVYADAGRHLDRALVLAQAELNVRGDIYTYDALAWALYKNGRTAEGAAATRKALTMNTPDPLLYYHAGMIAKAEGDRDAARQYLGRALQLNPEFDLAQAPIAAAAWKELQ